MTRTGKSPKLNPFCTTMPDSRNQLSSTLVANWESGPIPAVKTRTNQRLKPARHTTCQIQTKPTNQAITQHNHHDKTLYQIGVVARDKNFVVSLCAKFEFYAESRCMTRSSSNNLHDLDPKIDKTLHRSRKIKNTNVGSSDSFNFVSNSINNLFATNSEFPDYSNKPKGGENKSKEPEHMQNQDRTLKELGTLDVVYQPWCIQYLQLEPARSYELKSSLIHLLPKFHGLIGEDPHKHLKEFHMICSTMRPKGILEDYIKMKAFSFSLDGAAKDWLYPQPVLFHTWGGIKRMFMEKFFSASKTATIRCAK
ncbi:hypothetical protein CR513_15199, partial [Mucuna pruriens]